MAPLVDLREHFGIWERCGNSRFFEKNPDNPHGATYLNPIDGILVFVSKHEPWPKGEPTYTLTVRDASKAREGSVEAAYSRNYPWVKKAVTRFFYYKALGWALDAIRKVAGRSRACDADVRNFLELYQGGGEHYLKQGGGLPEGSKPMLEEALEGILRTIAELDGSIVDYGRGLSLGDLESALFDLGILEC